jgi:hypothetical protein
MASGLWLPRRYLKPVATVFWYSEKLDRIRVGAPEVFPIPQELQAEGYNKIVCRNAHEVEIWSQKLRDQERRDKEIEDAKREAIEGPIRDAIRSELVYKRDHARNAINRDAMQRAIENHDEAEDRRRSEKSISYMHSEGYEEGH